MPSSWHLPADQWVKPPEPQEVFCLWLDKQAASANAVRKALLGTEEFESCGRFDRQKSKDFFDAHSKTNVAYIRLPCLLPVQKANNPGGSALLLLEGNFSASGLPVQVKKSGVPSIPASRGWEGGNAPGLTTRGGGTLAFRSGVLKCFRSRTRF